MIPNEIREYMSCLGKKGRGKSKVRGDAAYYRKLALMRHKKSDTIDKSENKS